MSTEARSMAKGVGLYRKLVAKTAASIPSLVRSIHQFYEKPTPDSPSRATVVSVGKEVVVVEEWNSKSKMDAYIQSSYSHKEFGSDLIVSHSKEYFPEALHISKPIKPKTETVGILVRQKTASAEKGAQLRDAQREAYERQMTKEPNCTGCIILAGSEHDTSQARIIELWKTMKDFDFHETSEWHAKGEEKVVPLVIDMDCDFVSGWQLIQGR